MHKKGKEQNLDCRVNQLENVQQTIKQKLERVKLGKNTQKRKEEKVLLHKNYMLGQIYVYELKLSDPTI